MGGGHFSSCLSSEEACCRPCSKGSNVVFHLQIAGVAALRGLPWKHRVCLTPASVPGLESGLTPAFSDLLLLMVMVAELAIRIIHLSTLF